MKGPSFTCCLCALGAWWAHESFGMLAATIVPDPNLESTNMLPPAASSLSFMICKPKCLLPSTLDSSNPAPSSVTLMRTMVSSRHRRTEIREAPACFAAL